MVRGMIEAGVILLVFLVVGALFVGARRMAQNPRRDPAAERKRLHQSLAWHEERLRRAKQKNWDYEMVARITEELDDTRFQLARMGAAPAASISRE